MTVTIKITTEMQDAAYKFANEIIKSNNQYSRLSALSGQELERTYVGKLGELVFLSWLKDNGYSPDVTGMLDIFEGQTNVDEFDFQLKNGDSVDIKTGYQNNHRRLMVNHDQLVKIPKNLYVGVKLNGVVTNKKTSQVDLKSFSSATIFGFATHEDLMTQTSRDWGYARAHAIQYDLLQDINLLLPHF